MSQSAAIANPASVNLAQDIFAALIEKHDYQRQLCAALEKESDFAQRQAIFQRLKLELRAHEAAEERHLYVPVMQHDEGLDLSRHAITEHHEVDELLEIMEDDGVSEEKWESTCVTLLEKVRHHLDEEENKFFKQARTILDDELQQRLGTLYQAEHDAFAKAHADD